MITNKSNLPEAIIRAMQSDPYSSGGSDYTITQILRPVQMKALEDRHHDEITEDAEDGLYRLYGQIAHGILERANMADLAEKRFFMEIAGKKFSGQIDTLSLKDGVLTDYKFTTAWGFKASKPAKSEWVAQLNCQLELLRQNGFDAQKLQIVGLLRDWQIREAKTQPDYPQSMVVTLDIPIWSREATQAFIKMRINEHEAAKFTPAEMLPECSLDERFANEATWAVVKSGKNGKTRAINNGAKLKSEEDAQKMCLANPGTTVEFRRAEPTKRCLYYCKVSQFCSQFKKLSQKIESSEESA